MRIKVVIFGEGNAGKSTLVRHFNPTARNVDTSSREGYGITVGLDFGKSELGGYTLHFFGTPGQLRFEVARQVISRGAHLALILIDSSTDEGIPHRILEIEQRVIQKNLPYLLCANKRDMPNVIPLAELQRHFKSEIIPISAVTGEGIDHLRKGMIKLIDAHYGNARKAHPVSH